MKLTKGYKIQSWIFKKSFKTTNVLYWRLNNLSQDPESNLFSSLGIKYSYPEGHPPPLQSFILCECDNRTQPKQPSQRQFSSLFWKLQWAGSDHNNHWRRHELQRCEVSCASSPPCWAQGWVTRAWLSHLLTPDRCRKSRERSFRSHQSFIMLVHHHPSKGMWFQPANKTIY